MQYFTKMQSIAEGYIYILAGNNHSCTAITHTGQAASPRVTLLVPVSIFTVFFVLLVLLNFLHLLSYNINHKSQQFYVLIPYQNAEKARKDLLAFSSETLGLQKKQVSSPSLVHSKVYRDLCSKVSLCFLRSASHCKIFSFSSTFGFI